jgi:hypothetical protein
MSNIFADVTLTNFGLYPQIVSLVAMHLTVVTLQLAAQEVLAPTLLPSVASPNH